MIRIPTRLVTWVLTMLISISCSALYHLDTDLGRRLGRDILNEYVTGLMLGAMHIAQIERLRLWDTICKDVKVYDPHGAEVIHADEVHLTFSAISAVRGILHFKSADLYNGQVYLMDNAEGFPTFLDAFESSDPTPTDPDEEPFHAIVDDMHLMHVNVHGDLLGLRGMHIANMDVTGRMEFYHASHFEIWTTRGRFVRPFPFIAKLETLAGTVRTDEKGTHLHARASRGDERMHVGFDYGPPLGGGVDDEYIMDLRIHADPLDAKTFEQVGFTWAEILKGRVTGRARLYGPANSLSMEARALETSGGKVDIQGVLPADADVEIRIASTGMALAPVIEGAPDVIANGAVTFILPVGEDATNLDLDLGPFIYEGMQVPALDGRVVLLETSARLEGLRARGSHSELKIHGEISYEGALEGRVEGHIDDLAMDTTFAPFLPGARGSAEVDLHVKRPAANKISLRGWTTLQDFRYGELQAGLLHVDGTVVGNPFHPRANLTLDGGDILVAGYPIGHGEASIEGGPEDYRASGSFAASHGRKVSFAGDVALVDGGYNLNVSPLNIAMGDLKWEGELRGVRFHPRRGLSLENVSLHSGQQRLTARGEWSFVGDDDLSVELRSFDLAALRLIFPDEQLDFGGIVDLAFEFKGDLESRPVLSAEGTLSEGRVFDVAPMTAAYVIRYGDGEMQGDAQLDLGGAGNLSVNTTGILDPDETDILEALAGGVYEASVRAGALDLTLGHSFVGDVWPEMTGYLDGQVDMSGPIDAPTFRGKLAVPDFAYGHWSGLDLNSSFLYEYGALIARATGADATGDLLEAEGSLLIDLVALTRDPQQTLSTLDTSPWRFAVRIPPRVLGSLPLGVRRRLPNGLENLRVSASATLAGGAFKTRGDLLASLDWLGNLSDALCATDSNPRSTWRAHLEDDVTTLSIAGLVDERNVVEVNATAKTPLGTWLRDAEKPERPVVQIDARIKDLPTEDVPFVCHYAGGSVNGDVSGVDLFGRNPTLRLHLESDDLRAHRIEPAFGVGGKNTIVRTPPATLSLTLGYAKGLGELAAEAEWWNGGSTSIQATTPMRWPPGEFWPSTGSKGRVTAEASFDQMPLQAALAWMSGAVNVEGFLQGVVTADGPIKQPRLSGDLLVSDGRVDMHTLGQTLRDVEGQLIFDSAGDLTLDLRARDGRGTATATGKIGMDRLKPKEADVQFRFKNFPVRQEGSVIAAIDSVATAKAEFGKDSVKASLHPATLRIDVPATTVTPQELSAHPEVHFTDDDDLATPPKRPYRIELELDANKRFWVASKDRGFLAHTSADLTIDYDGSSLVVDGGIKLYEGYFEVQGKRFEVQTGSLIFDHTPDFNPTVNLVAIHKLRGGSDTITLTASGELDKLDVEFASTVPTESQSQIIALLITGSTRQERGQRGSTEDASADAANFLAGVAGGLFASTLRGRLGRLAPTFNVLAGDKDTEVQVGFNVDEVLPESWRKVITGLYVEGQLITRRVEGVRDASGQAQRAGFLVEMQFPKSIVGTITYGQPSDYSFDLTWEP